MYEGQSAAESLFRLHCEEYWIIKKRACAAISECHHKRASDHK